LGAVALDRAAGAENTSEEKTPMTYRRSILAAALLCPAMFAASSAAWDGQREVAFFQGKVDAPDVMGGYPSTHIIIRLAPGVQPLRLDDERLTLARFLDGRAAGMGDAEFAIADALERWAVADVIRTMPFEPANPVLAAQLGLDRYHTVRVPQGTDVKRMAAEMGAFEAHVEVAETDSIGGLMGGPSGAGGPIPNDPSFNVQYGLYNTGQSIQGQVGVPGADINAVAGWGIHTGDPSVILAVIDTGVSGSHADLAGKLVPGYNAVDGNSDTSDSWLISHGTHVAGIAAAATNNATGIAGVAWGCRIMPVKVLNLFGGGTETGIANGVLWAADNGAHFGNMSLGTPDGITYYENAINYAHAQGMLIIAASGNTPGALIPFPARWPSTMAVGATDNRDLLASFTTTGPQMSVTAPGVNIYSTWAAFLSGPYSYQSGTSMATPHVVGLAGLVRSVNPSLANDEVRAIIELTADDLGAPGWDPQFGHGRINAHAALLAASDTGDPPCPADLNGDGAVDVFDLLALLGAWGECDDAGSCPADLTGDGSVDVFDLLALLGAWGEC
jgi:thermitase